MLADSRGRQVVVGNHTHIEDLSEAGTEHSRMVDNLWEEASTRGWAGYDQSTEQRYVEHRYSIASKPMSSDLEVRTTYPFTE